MKVIVGLVVVIAIVGAILYYSGMFKMTSPDELAQRVKSAANAHGSWETVVEISKPRIYYDVVMHNASGRGAEQRFDRDAFADRVAKHQISEGALLQYNMAADIAFEVEVKPDGTIEGYRDLATMKTLLHPGGM